MSAQNLKRLGYRKRQRHKRAASSWLRAMQGQIGAVRLPADSAFGTLKVSGTN
jgi:hypothetical protein